MSQWHERPDGSPLTVAGAARDLHPNSLLIPVHGEPVAKAPISRAIRIGKPARECGQGNRISGETGVSLTWINPRASCKKVGTGFLQKTMRQQKPRAICVIHKSRILL
jgi:hypothetical protein